MSKKLSVIAALLCVFITASASASTDPSESAGLRHLFSAYGGIFLLDFDKSQKLVNETPSGDRMVLDDYRDGFRLLQNVNEGLGVEVPINYAIPGGLTVGLDLLVGKNVSFDRYVRTREDVDQIGRPRIPTRAADLSSWTAGDNVLFLARGGVGFAFGIGLTPVAGAAAYYYAEGDWFLYIEKTANDHVYLKLTSTGLHSFGVLANSIIVGLGTDVFAEADKGFSFSYDLNNADARRAYEDALHGSLGPSDRMAAAGTGNVKRVLTTQSASLGAMRNWYFGIPLLDTIGGKTGQIYSYDNTYNHEDGSDSAVHSGIYVDQTYSAGWLSDHERHVNDFFGSAFTHHSGRGVESKGYLGQYFWAFESTHVSSRKVHEELARLAAKTGLVSAQSIDVPNEKHLGYLNIKFTAELSRQTTDALLDWARSSPAVMADLLTGTGQGGIEDYFQSGADPSALCNASGSDLGACKTGLLSETRLASRQMVSALQAMAETRDRDPKAFARHFGEFGKEMATNQFTFKEVLALTHGAPMTLTLALEGERISLFKTVIAPPTGSFALR